MKAIIAKDTFGVTVWSEEAALVFQPAFRSMSDTPVFQDTNLKWYQGQGTHLIMNSRAVKKFWPSLGAHLVEGQRQWVNIVTR